MSKITGTLFSDESPSPIKAAACITTLNEEKTISALVAKLLKAPSIDRVIVADAGSTDRTALRAHDAGAAVLPMKRGTPIGPALMAAWRKALDADCDMIIQLDAGGSHDPDDLLWKLDVCDGDMTVGSRFMPGAVSTPFNFHRRWASWAFAKLFNLRNATNLTDVSSGFRIFSALLVQELLKMNYRAKMHGWQIEVLRNAVRLGARIDEVPITYHAGRSSLKWHIALEGLREVLS